MGVYDDAVMNYLRHGEKEKVNWLKNLDKTLLPSQVKRISQNDKTVLLEMVIPKWVDWNVLYDWAQNKKNSFDNICILCDNSSENGISYHEKHICESCFLKLKHMQ